MHRTILAAARKVFVAGGSITPFTGKGSPHFIDKKHPDFGKKENPTIEELISTVTNEALTKSNVSDPSDVDRIAIGNFVGELFVNQGHLGAAVTGSLKGLKGKPSMRVEGACASGALAVEVAHDAIVSGRADIALAVGAEVQTTTSPRTGGDYLARASHYRRQRGLDDFTFPALFARRMKNIAAAGHFTQEDAARVSAKAYANGNKNPLAHMTSVNMPFETANNVSKSNPNFLQNDELKPWLRVSDCSQVSDGASAIVLVSEEGAKKLSSSKDLIEILSLRAAAGDLYEDPVDYTVMDTSKLAATKAFADTNITPKDLQVAEVHDCFSIAELLMYEALGIADYGEAKKLIRDGETTLEGRIPVNTGGGLISFGHPVGATGVKQIFEVYRQMKGLSGDYQMKSIPTFGAALNMGGDDKTAVCTILKNL